MSLKITLEDIKSAANFLAPYIEKTPMKDSNGIHGVKLKCENFQKTGSFKIRGALNKIGSLSDQEKSRGVVAASAGNHAQGVALGAKLFDVKATIVMPEGAPLTKIENTKNFGAKVIQHGSYFDLAFEKAQELMTEQGLVLVHPYRDAHVIAGQGTIGLEILESFSDVEQVVVPVGGGGLISGIATAIKTINPNCKIIGVVPEGAAGMKELKDGINLSNKKKINTIADGLAIKHPNAEIFKEYIEQLVERIVSVSDAQISEAIVQLMEKDKMIVEGSGAAGYAAVLSGLIDTQIKTCVVICGGNIDLNTVQAVIETGLRQKGRLHRVGVIVDDLPGSLARLTELMAEQKANVLDVVHDRVSTELNIRETRIDFVLETTGFDHIERIHKELRTQHVRLIGEHLQ